MLGSNVRQSPIHFDPERLTNGVTSSAINGDKPINFDLPDVVNLLQVLGYRTKYADITPESYKLRDNGEGSRITITCSHSGQRFVMEKLIEKDICRCVDVGSKGMTKDIILEAAPESLENTELIPPLINEQTDIIKPVMGYLFNLIKGIKPESGDSVPAKFTCLDVMLSKTTPITDSSER